MNQVVSIHANDWGQHQLCETGGRSVPYVSLLLAYGVPLVAMLLGLLNTYALLNIFWLELAIIGGFVLLAVVAGVVFIARFGASLLDLGVF